MAKIIEFYIPGRYRNKAAWVPPQRRGKVIEFCLREKKPANLIEDKTASEHYVNVADLRFLMEMGKRAPTEFNSWLTFDIDC